MIAHDSTAGVSTGLSMPALSPGMVRLQTLLASRGCGVADVTGALNSDPRLATYVLHVAHVMRERGDPIVKSIPQAVCVLGLSSLAMIAMRGAAMLAFEETQSCGPFDVDEFWRHSILAAHVGRELAGRMPARVNGLSADQLYACVLLHDIGQLVLLRNLGPQYAGLHSHVEAGQDSTRVEDELLGRNHAQVGAQLATQWGLPEPVPERIGMHHVQECPDDRAELARIIATSDRIAHAIASKSRPPPIEIVRSLAKPPQTITTAHLIEVVTSATQWYAKVDLLLLGSLGK
jgi:HD-like signal output (HDOD) protein